MRFNPVFWLVLTTIFVTGCQKEYSLETDQDLTPAGEGLLISASMINAVSEITYTYEYNAAKQPLRNLFSASAPGFNADGIITATRDAAGKVTFSQFVLQSNISAGSDTIHYEIKRNAAGKISYVLLKPADTTNTFGYDSIVYAYNTAGKLSGNVVYIVEYGTGIAEPMQAFEFTFSGENMTKSVEYELSGSLTSRKLVETVTLFYDDKPAARVLTEDDFIANLAPINNIGPSVNNTIKYSQEYADDPGANVITEYKYVYGANGKPISAEVTIIRQPGIPTDQANLIFTYQ